MNNQGQDHPRPPVRDEGNMQEDGYREWKLFRSIDHFAGGEDEGTPTREHAPCSG